MKAIFYPDVPFDTLKIPEILKEIYFDKLYDPVLIGKSDLTIVDMGANLGLVTQFMRSYARKIYAIEPSPLEFYSLQKNKVFNNWDNVELFSCAISDKDGWAVLSVNNNNRTGNSIIPGKKNPDGSYLSTDGKFMLKVMEGDYTERVQVPTKRLDTFFSENSIEHVHFMKMDVEGSEGIILRSEGFRNVVDKIDALEVEFHFPDWIDLTKLVMDMGFKGQMSKTDATVFLFFR